MTLAAQRRAAFPHNGQPVWLYVYRGGKQDAPWQGEKCGTYAGWNDHRRNNEPACVRCKRAHADYMREYRLRRGITKSIRVRVTPAMLKLLAPK